MKTSKLILTSLLNAMGVAVYIVGVSLIIRNGEKIFGKMENIFGPIAFLLLFVLSAAITGSLVFARPVFLFLENRKAEAVKIFLYTLGWLFAITLIIFIALILKR